MAKNKIFRATVDGIGYIMEVYAVGHSSAEREVKKVMKDLGIEKNKFSVWEFNLEKYLNK